MYNSKRQKNIIIGGLLAIVCIMAIGYAAFASNLNISGSGAISSNWSVKITNITSKDIVGTAGNKNAPTYTDTTATFATTLQSPGDSITYDITVSNEGTLDAKLDKITLSNSNNPAITFEKSGLAEGNSILKGTSEILTIKVTYKSSVTSQPETLTADLTVTLDFVQKGVNSEGIVEPTVGDKLLASEGTVTTGDGLYADSIESGRYFYKGTTVDNYITFNDETWRIMSVESDGTIKIIRDASIGSYSWDAKGTRSSSTSTYCTDTYGCNAWAATTNLVGIPSVFILSSPNGNLTSDSTTYSGTVTQDASLNTYLNGEYYNNLSSTAKSKVVKGTFNVSTPGRYTDTETLEVDAQQEKQYQWKGYVALMTVTELLRTSASTACTSLDTGWRGSCNSNNWLWITCDSYSWEWTLSPIAGSDSDVVFQRPCTSSSLTTSGASGAAAIRPVLHLASDITLSGSGTSSDPYTITG